MSAATPDGPYADLIARAVRALMRADDTLDANTVRLMALDIVNMDEAALDAVLAAARAPRRTRRTGPDTTARGRIEHARRKLLLPMAPFLDALAARLDAEYALGIAATPKSHRRSLNAFVALAAELGAPADLVAGAAETFARERSLGYDIA